MTIDLYNIPRTVQHELNTLLLGQRLGGGAYREVYEAFGAESAYVVKIEETDSREFCNVLEWDFWREAQGTPLETWLAPCHSISHSGSVLIQCRTRPLKKLPDEVPDIFHDVKLENWGFYRGRPVCHDYAFHRAMSRGLKRFKMRKLSK